MFVSWAIVANWSTRVTLGIYKHGMYFPYELIIWVKYIGHIYKIKEYLIKIRKQTINVLKSSDLFKSFDIAMWHVTN